MLVIFVCIDLFVGVGGFFFGVIKVGYEVCVVVEYNKYVVVIY